MEAKESLVECNVRVLNAGKWSLCVDGRGCGLSEMRLMPLFRVGYHHAAFMCFLSERVRIECSVNGRNAFLGCRTVIKASARNFITRLYFSFYSGPRPLIFLKLGRLAESWKVSRVKEG